MRRFCFVHAADLHLDTPFEGIGRVAPEIRSALVEASLDAWNGLVDLTLDREAAFLLIAGDIYDGAERGVRAQLAFRRGLERLSNAGIPTLIVHGNHDPLQEGWSAIRDWPPGVTIFGSERVEKVEIAAANSVSWQGEVLATVYGISYAQGETRENLALRFRREEGSGLQIGILHCNVGGTSEHAPYSPCSRDDLIAAGMDYWALGHVHRQQIEQRGGTWIVYPGNLQGRSPKASERGAKGAVVVEVAEGSVRAVEPVALDRVRFADLEVDAAGFADLGQLEAALFEQACSLRDEQTGRALVLRAWIGGRTRLHRDLARNRGEPGGTLADLLAALRQQSASLRPFLWWQSLVDRTRPPLDRAAILARNDFSAELLRVAAGHVAEPERLADFVREETALLEQRRLPVGLPALAEVDLPELLARAEQRALDLLEVDEA